MGIMKRELTHVCTLVEDVEVETPVTFAKWCRPYIRVSPINPCTKIFFRSHDSLERERVRHAEIKTLVVHPMSIFRMYWELIYTVIFGISLFMNPMYMIFFPLRDIKNFGISITYSLVWGELLLDLLSFVDLMMTFMTGHLRYTKKTIILAPLNIARHYFFSWNFWVDLICSLPIHVLLSASCFPWPHLCETDKLRVLKTARLFGILKILRAYKFLKYLKNTTDIMRHWYHMRAVLKYYLIMILGFHWLICIYIMIVQYFRYQQPVFIISDNTGNLVDYNEVDTYCRTMNTVLTTVLGISLIKGFRKAASIKHDDDDELIIFICYSIIGYWVCNILLVLIIQYILSMNASETKYHAIITQVSQYMIHKDFPYNMRNRILTYYEYRFQRKYFRECAISSMLSETLRRDINVHSCRTLIDNVSLLKDLPPEIVTEVVANLKYEVFLYHDLIAKANTVGDCMFFIENGTVAVSTPSGKEICHLQDGAYFGEIALLSKTQKRIANVVAIEICEIYRLDRKNFRNCFPTNSMHYKKIEQIAKERSEKTMLLEELHKKYILEKTTRRFMDPAFINNILPNLEI